MAKSLGIDQYTVGIICALPHEMAAAIAMLDETHEPQEQDSSDHNSYKLGKMHGHNIVIATLPAGLYGNTPAATVAKDMLRTFKQLRFGLMVGIGGAAPSEENDIRLGDIVVSEPSGTFGGVVQFDRGRSTASGFERTGFLNSPPTLLLASLNKLKASHEINESSIPTYLTDMIKKYPKMAKQFKHLGADNDHLYEADYVHPSGDTCIGCDPSKRKTRPERTSTEPEIHYGTIASSNQVMKNAIIRDTLQKELGVLCFEMEAAGLADFPCLVIRGISDYSDSHKNSSWQRYAAATAAAFAKEFLSLVPVAMVTKEKPAIEISGH